QSYEHVLRKIEHARARDKLREFGQDHQRRAQLLRERLELLGHTPPETEGRGSGFARLPHLGSNDLAVTEQSLLQSMAEGEEYELQDYEAKLPRLDEETRRFVETELLSAQRRTHSAVKELQRALH
ncbi:MAG TPA: hypothetical protein VFO83_02490, partial [Aggregicoccus sp.]|nr:hypothetical protein [Aggregicoccus sp.]